MVIQLSYKKIILWILIILITTIIIFFIYSSPKEKYPYTNNPKDWIETKGEIKEINVDGASMGQAEAKSADITLYLNDTESVISYEGYYNGIYFKKEYIENGKKKMEITHTLNPNDGIIQSFTIERIMNSTYEVIIFVDEDWKNKVKMTNIIWGRNYDKIKKFDFTQKISNGVYMNKIIDDPTRFGFNHLEAYSGIIVGSVTLEDIQNGVTEGKTAIIFQ